MSDPTRGGGPSRSGDHRARATTRRALLAAVGAATATAGCLGGDGGDDPGTTTVTDEFEFSTSAFDDGATVPRKFTCDGENVSPPMSVGDPPSGTETLAIIVDDPDAPGGTFTHWLLWNVPADRASIPEGIPKTETAAALGGAPQGTNDAGSLGYTGPCPPEGDDPHTYRFTAYAVDSTLELEPGIPRGDLSDDLSGGATLATSRFTGEYGRE